MQIIDQNTYIDDSLITCAEYQLFIDEMRDQGQSYQPLHWPTYQFPEGYAREPMLGVRQSDALMFGEWMTWQENDGWRFRLPTIQEAESFPLKPFKQSPLGYWLNEAHYFAWIGAVPWDAGRINSLAKDLAREFAALREIGYERDLIRARSNYFHLEDRSASNEDRQSRDRNDAENDEKALAQARLRTESRADALERSRVRAFNRAQVLDLDLVFTRGRALDLGLAFVSVDPINRADVLARDISRARELVFDHAYTPNEVFDNALDVFIDLFTLQERIAGRSPAFEGIRLVKELIR